MTSLVRLAAEVGVLYVPGVIRPLELLPGVPFEKAGLSDRAILGALFLERGEVKLPADPGPGEKLPDNLTRVGVTGYSVLSRREDERFCGVEGNTGGGVRGAESTVVSGGGVSILDEGFDPSADAGCDPAPAEKRSRGKGAIGGEVGRTSWDRLDVVADPLRLGVACKSIGNAMNTNLPVGWSRDSERLMEEAVPGAVAIDRPEDS